MAKKINTVKRSGGSSYIMKKSNITFDVVITRHNGLIDYLKREGIIDESIPVISSASEADVAGKNVLGVLPLSLVAHANTVTEIPLNLHQYPELRGKELDAETVRTIAGAPVTTKTVFV